MSARHRRRRDARRNLDRLLDWHERGWRPVFRLLLLRSLLETVMPAKARRGGDVEAM
jgi:hypothetical protein